MTIHSQFWGAKMTDSDDVTLEVPAQSQGSTQGMVIGIRARRDAFPLTKEGVQ
ncbi:hypothetical protein [Aromatoleum diolicum]|uniref:Uncharacterized protein n=1 Tax=Aromatoleum diolicum TaxID=75796 RepID=A0ABX1QE20_9RHOO|nr:hypothetical protein [Aromatoleum diolicum]NMG75755.1 hypothetical protein [Aromatoleum diolicum]